jgi:shikimate kinase
MRHKVNRPLLRGSDGNTLDESTLRKRITDLMRNREEYYGRADVIIQTDQQRIGSTVDDLVKQLRLLKIS